MKRNMGTIDRTIRTVVAVVIALQTLFTKCSVWDGRERERKDKPSSGFLTGDT